MDWEVIGATGEWAGALAVVASLIYLATQVRQSNRQSQAEAQYSFLDAYGQLHASLIENKAAAAVFRRGMAGEELDEDEAFQFFLSLGHWINTWGVMYELHEAGQLPEGQWSIVRQDIYEMLTTPGGRAYWNKFGQDWMDPGFTAMVEMSLRRQDSTHNILKPLDG